MYTNPQCPMAKKTIYVTVGIIKYRVQSWLIDNRHEYNTHVSIKMMDTRFPTSYYTIKGTDNVRKFATTEINSWLKK